MAEKNCKKFILNVAIDITTQNKDEKT